MKPTPDENKVTKEGNERERHRVKQRERVKERELNREGDLKKV